MGRAGLAVGDASASPPVAGASDTYTITTRSGQCVDVHGASMADNATITQWPCHGGSGGSPASNTGLVQLPCSASNGRVWRLPATAAEQVVFNLTRPNGAGTMWAPEFHLLDGPNGKRWYFYYTAGREPFDLGTQRIHVLESAGLDPMGPHAHLQRRRPAQLLLLDQVSPLTAPSGE